MSSQEPFNRVSASMGAQANGSAQRAIWDMIEQISTNGYRTSPEQIAEVRARLASTEMKDETRTVLEEHLLHKEYWWHRNRPVNLVRFAMETPTWELREAYLREARESRQAFERFAAAHPDIAISACNVALPTIEELMTQYPACSSNT